MNALKDDFGITAEASGIKIPLKLVVVSCKDLILTCTSIGTSLSQGRNDILVHNQKVSGSAYKIANGKAMHHGTLLLHVDFNALGRYLNPDKAKLKVTFRDSLNEQSTLFYPIYVVSSCSSLHDRAKELQVCKRVLLICRHSTLRSIMTQYANPSLTISSRLMMPAVR